MVPLPEFNPWLVLKRPTRGFRLWHHNVILGSTATILKHQCVLWCKPRFGISNRLGVVWHTDGTAIATAAFARQKNVPQVAMQQQPHSTAFSYITPHHQAASRHLPQPSACRHRSTVIRHILIPVARPDQTVISIIIQALSAAVNHTGGGGQSRKCRYSCCIIVECSISK